MRLLLPFIFNVLPFHFASAAPGVIEKGDGLNGRYTCFSNDGVNCSAPKAQDFCAQSPTDDFDNPTTPTPSPTPSLKPSTTPSASKKPTAE